MAKWRLGQGKAPLRIPAAKLQSQSDRASRRRVRALARPVDLPILSMFPQHCINPCKAFRLGIREKFRCNGFLDYAGMKHLIKGFG
jgi:hypothetical protein